MDDSRSRRTRRLLVAYLFLIPAATFYLTVVIVPVMRSIVMSFYHVTPGVTEFVGLDNFARLVHDEVFRQSLGHNLLLVVLSLVIQIPIALLLATLLSGRTVGRGVFRTGFFMPMMLSTVVIGLLTRMIFRPDVGLVNSVLKMIPGIQSGPNWFGQGCALITVIIAISWRYVGFHMMLFVAGIEGIPEELYEAARIDGAGSWACFRHVTLPGLRRVIAISALLSVVGSLKYFDLVYIITRGGPGHASELMTTYMFNIFNRLDWGYASAIAVAALCVSLVAASAYMFVLRRTEKTA